MLSRIFRQLAQWHGIGSAVTLSDCLCPSPQACRPRTRTAIAENLTAIVIQNFPQGLNMFKINFTGNQRQVVKTQP